MRYIHRIHPRADADIIDAAGYLARQREGLGTRFLDEVIDAIAQLTQRPTWTAMLDDAHFPGVRRKSLRSFPKWHVFFRVDGRRVTILRVLHGARDISACLDEVHED